MLSQKTSGRNHHRVRTALRVRLAVTLGLVAIGLDASTVGAQQMDPSEAVGAKDADGGKDAVAGKDAIGDDAATLASDGPWYLIPRFRAPPGARFIDAIGAGRQIYVLDDQGVLHTSRDFGVSFAARELSTVTAGVWRSPLASVETPPLFWGLTSSGKTNYVGSMNLYLLMGDRYRLRWNISDSFSFPYGTTGEPYLELSPDSPAFNGGIWVPGVPRPGSWNFTDEETRVNAAYGGAGRLLSRTGKSAKRLHVVTADLGQPLRVAVAGRGGILISRDGGLTFDVLRESPPFKCCEAVVFAGDRLVGTTERTLVMRSRGLGDPIMPGAVVPRVEWVVRDKGDAEHLLFVAVQELLESFDGGLSARRVFVAQASRINHVAIDPGSGRIFIATMTGLFVRAPGESLFVEASVPGPVHAVEVNPIRPQEVLLTRFRSLLRSTNGGQSFRNFMELDGASVGMLDPVPGRGWVLVTERGVYSLSRTPPVAVPPARIALARYLLRTQPLASQALRAAYERFVPVPPTRSWFDEFLPRVHMMAGALVGPQRAALDYVPLTTIAGDTRAPDTVDRTVRQGDDATLTRNRLLIEPFAVCVLSWDLPGAAGPPVRTSREREAATRFRDVQDTVSRLHSVRSRLLVERIVRPPSDVGSVLDLELRIEEMTAQLNALTAAGYRVPNFSEEVDDVPTDNDSFDNVPFDDVPRPDPLARHRLLPRSGRIFGDRPGVSARP